MPAAIDTMGYVGATPWHGLGQELRGVVSVDEMRQASGLTWDPLLVEQRYRLNPNGESIDKNAAVEQIVKDLANRQIGRATAIEKLQALLSGEDLISPDRVLVRSDTGAILDTVGKKYQALSNAWVFEFFRTYCELGGLTMETAGSLDGGRYVWCLAKVDKSFKLAGGDEVDEYVLLYNPNVYGKGARAKLTLIRVVCKNTLTMALKSATDKDVKMWHAKPFDEDRRKEVQSDLAAINAQFSLIHEAATALSELKLDTPDAKILTYQIMENKAETPEMLETVEGWEEHATKKAKRVYELYAGAGIGADLESAKGTGWGLLNAVTQYVDWERGNSQDSRLLVSWFTYGETLKQTGLERLLLEAGQPDLAKAIVRQRVAER